MDQPITRLEIELKDEGAVVVCWRKPKPKKGKDLYDPWSEERKEFAFNEKAGAIAKVEALLAEVK